MLAALVAKLLGAVVRYTVAFVVYKGNADAAPYVHPKLASIVIVNYTDTPQPVRANGIVEVSSVGAGEGSPFTGTLAPNEAVILS